MYCGDRSNTNSEEDMAELLSAFDDESDDEVVEFVHSSLRNSSSNGLLGENVINRGRAVENGVYEDGDLVLHLPDESNRFRVRGENEFSAPWLYSRTICLFVSFIGLGIVMGILGPTLLDLEIQTCSNAEEIPYLFTLRSIGYLLGSMLGGYLFDKFNSYLILSLSCMFAGITVGMTSIGGSIYSLLLIVFLQGVCLGSLDTGANVLVIFLWKKRSAPYMQALHFMFAIGTFLAPLIAKPFLLIHNEAFLVVDSNTTQRNASIPSDVNCEGLQKDLKIRWAYVLAAFPLIASCLVFLMFSCISMPCEKPSKPSELHYGTKTPRNKIMKLLVMLSLGLVFFLYVGSEITYGGFVFSFAVKSDLHFSKAHAADITAAFWGSMAVFRFLSIFISRYISSFRLILSDLIGCVIASLVLMIWGNSSVPCLWLGSILMGASMASVYPSAVTWAEKIVEVNGRSISLLVNFSAFGEMMIPLIAGSVIAKYGAATFVVTMGISIILTFASFFSTIFINKQRKLNDSKALAAHFQRFREEEDDDISGMGNEEIAKLLEHTDDYIKREMERESIL